MATRVYISRPLAHTKNHGEASYLIAYIRYLVEEPTTGLWCGFMVTGLRAELLRAEARRIWEGK